MLLGGALDLGLTGLGTGVGALAERVSEIPPVAAGLKGLELTKEAARERIKKQTNEILDPIIRKILPDAAQQEWKTVQAGLEVLDNQIAEKKALIEKIKLQREINIKNIAEIEKGNIESDKALLLNQNKINLDVKEEQLQKELD